MIRQNIRRTYPVLLIVVVAWIANFLHFTEFGFYEDDWFYFAAPYLTPASIWFRQLKYEIVHFLLGRPLQSFCMYVFGFVGAAFSSIALVYLLAFVFLAVSAVLMYYVLKLKFPALFATIAALLFVLSPLTTVKQSLNIELSVGPGFVALFIAILLYNRRRRFSAGLLAILSLIAYEPLFFLYWAAPLFRRGKWTARRIREAGAHVAVCAGITVAYVLARRYLAESRVVNISHGPIETVWLMAKYDILFTASSFKAYVYALYIGLRELSLEPVLYCLLVLVPALVVLLRLWHPSSTSASTSVSTADRFVAARRRWWLWNGVGSGILLLALGYSLAYFNLYQDWTFPLSGRDTRASSAASFGSSILAAVILFFLLTAFRGRLLRTAGQFVLAGCLSILLLYSFVIQKDYSKEWVNEKNFLTQLIMLSPDVRRDTFFVVQAPWLEESLFLRQGRRPSIGFQRSDVILKALFGFDHSPRLLFAYSDQWSNYLKLHSDGKLYWTQEVFPGAWGRSLTDPLTPGRIIVIREDDDASLIRMQTPLWVDGAQIVQMPESLAGGAAPESNWPLAAASPLLRQVVPPFVASAVTVSVGDVPSGQPIPISGAMSLDSMELAFDQATIERGHPAKVVTADGQGAFAASIAIKMPPTLKGRRYIFLRARVIKGRIGVGILDSKSNGFQLEKNIDPSPGMLDIYLPVPVPERAAALIIRNTAGGVRSEVLIEDAAIVISSKLPE
jgi:hypothetical protein